MKKILFISIFTLGITLLVFNSSSIQAQSKLPLPTTPPTLKLSDPLPGNLFVELGKAINPAVVNISTSIIPRQRRGQYRDPLLEMLEQFYGQQNPGYYGSP